MENDFNLDKNNLIKSIESYYPHYMDYALINLVKRTTVTFSPLFEEAKVIPTFEFINPFTVQSMLKDELIVIALKGYRLNEVINILDVDHEYLEIDVANVNKFEQKCHEIFLKENECLIFEWRPTYYEEYTGQEEGPEFVPCEINVVCLIDLNRVRNYIKIQEVDAFPEFKNNTLILNNNRLEFKGYQAQMLKHLINNLNSICSKEEIFNTREENISYSAASKKTSKGNINSILESTFKEVKEKIKKDKYFKDILIFVQENGFGLFLDQRRLHS